MYDDHDAESVTPFLYPCDCLQKHGHIYNPHSKKCWNEQLAALRTRLEAVEQENKAYVEHFKSRNDDGYETPFDELQQRLAKVEQDLKQERNEHEEDVSDLVKHCACEWEGEEPRVLKVECMFHRNTREQLATAQARIVELEQALRLHLAVAPDDPLLIDQVEWEVVRLRARVQALETELLYLVTTRERSLHQRTTINWGHAKALVSALTPSREPTNQGGAS